MNGVILTTDDLRRAAPTLYRQMLDGWRAGGAAYREHMPSAALVGILGLRWPGERWQDLLIDGQAPEVDEALWLAASCGVDGPTLAAAIRATASDVLFYVAAAGRT